MLDIGGGEMMKGVHCLVKKLNVCKIYYKKENITEKRYK